jgi:Pyridoxamine 5'-phosphate oxidase
MHETDADFSALQELLDRSYQSAGSHLREITTPPRRVDARQTSERLQGMCLLSVATVTADGRPLVGAVDGIFYRGRFHFGSSPDSVRFRHLRRRPAVSAMHLPGEEVAFTVHGRAVFIDITAAEHAGFRRTLLDIYTPRYGEEWEESFLNSGPQYVRIEAERMFTFRMQP